MTKNQIDYWNLQENIRSHHANEALGKGTLEETQRSNKANEALKHETNAINEIHYQNQDRLGFMNLEETKRHDITGENLTAQTIQETQRHSLVTEQQTARDLERKESELNETIRSHKANEYINSVSNQIAKQNADTNRINAITNQRNADTNERNAATSEYNAETSRKSYLVDFDKSAAEINKMQSETQRNVAEQHLTEAKLEYQNKENAQWQASTFANAIEQSSRIGVNYSNIALNNVRGSTGWISSVFRLLE